MGKLSRIRQLKELLAQEKVDIVGLQETIRKDFSPRELESLTPGKHFVWNWILAVGHSGGILVGVKNDILEIEGWELGTFFVSATIRNRTNLNGT